ncbi:MAG: hypothetical protein HY289_14290, partial [Planctomycetes bacterium]|nr:hypothetical protein [Planctomycetota bacterium]
LDKVLAKVEPKSDFRIDGTTITITTPERAFFTVEHDIRGPAAKAESLGVKGSVFRVADQAQRAALLVDRLVTTLSLPQPVVGETFEVLNGTRLVIRATGVRHTEFVGVMGSFTRLGDVAVTTQCKLYEVDDAFYKKIKKAKRLRIEDEEKLLLQGKLAQGVPLAQYMAKQTLLVTGDEVSVDNGHMTTLLAKQAVHQCLPSPQQFRAGQKELQTFFTGLVLNGVLEVSPDRRLIHVALTEKGTELDEIRKVKDLGLRIIEHPGKGQEVAPAKDIAEIPILNETKHTRTIDLPDGGTRVVALHYRPRSLEEKKRWLVLVITARIVMEEEERRFLEGYLENAMPALVADVLSNPRLKTTRDYCGTPGDKRFALVKSDAWTWPKDFQPKIKGFDLTDASPKGQRLLGIRIDRFQWATSGLEVHVTFVNAGGSDNGQAPGGCTLRYSARSDDERWKVELMDR